MSELTEAKIIDLIERDEDMMSILRLLETFRLPDWCIFAGFVRNKAWDHVHGNRIKTPASDIDIAFFDKSRPTLEAEIIERLYALRPDLQWDVKNQAFAHLENDDSAYADCADALSKQPETITSVGVRMTNGIIELIAPHGISDLAKCIVRPTPIMYEIPERRQIVIDRLYSKKLFLKWPQLRVEI